MGQTIRTTSGCLMKEYESCYDLRMPPQMPIIIRIDGNSFHSWTKRTGVERPFDERLTKLMAETTRHLCENISDCVFGYTQSDEISLLISHMRSPFTESWFGRRLEKILSISASVATYYFNVNNPFDIKIPAYFDARAFSIPETQVKRYFIWRQKDAVKNSLFSLARSFYSHEKLVGASRDVLHEMCFLKGQNWAHLPVARKRGVGVYKREILVETGQKPTYRNRLFIDYNIPTFTNTDKFFDILMKKNAISSDSEEMVCE